MHPDRVEQKGEVVATQRYTIQVTEATHRALGDLTARSGESAAALLERLVARYEREQSLAEANAAWAAIQADPTARSEVEAEQALWEGTLADGLGREQW